tara:strand:- start:1271 stop:1888 length:618 start_codon:yes stop_codon:yes gene_type:complete
MILLAVACPDDVHEGEPVSVERPSDGASFEVPLPTGVAPGEIFHVEVPEEEPRGGTSGLDALAADMSAQREAAADCRGREARAVVGSEVLAHALRSILLELERIDELDDFIEGHAGHLANWTPHGEQELRWTALHAQYVALVEEGVATALERMRCSADEVFEHARAHGRGDPATDRLLSKLVATADYTTFCELMLAVHRCGGMGV